MRLSVKGGVFMKGFIPFCLGVFCCGSLILLGISQIERHEIRDLKNRTFNLEVKDSLRESWDEMSNNEKEY